MKTRNDMDLNKMLKWDFLQFLDITSANRLLSTPQRNKVRSLFGLSSYSLITLIDLSLFSEFGVSPV